MKDWVRYYLAEILAVVALVAFVVLVVVGAFALVAKSCHEFGEIAQVETRWDVWSGCYLQVDGEWVPRDLWRFNEGTR